MLDRPHQGLVVGWVTLNHLSWANLLGVPTAGMFLQGNDPSGIKIRADMEKMGISTEHVHVSDDCEATPDHAFVYPHPAFSSFVLVTVRSPAASPR